jgi:hypothetical protein
MTVHGTAPIKLVHAKDGIVSSNVQQTHVIRKGVALICPLQTQDLCCECISWSFATLTDTDLATDIGQLALAAKALDTNVCELPESTSNIMIWSPTVAQMRILFGASLPAAAANEM